MLWRGSKSGCGYWNFQFLFVCLFVCLFTCLSVPHVMPISQEEMVQSWYQKLFWNQGCDVVSNLVVEIEIYNFDLFYTVLERYEIWIIRVWTLSPGDSSDQLGIWKCWPSDEQAHPAGPSSWSVSILSFFFTNHIRSIDPSKQILLAHPAFSFWGNNFSFCPIVQFDNCVNLLCHICVFGRFPASFPDHP